MSLKILGQLRVWISPYSGVEVKMYHDITSSMCDLPCACSLFQYIWISYFHIISIIYFYSKEVIMKCNDNYTCLSVPAKLELSDVALHLIELRIIQCMTLIRFDCTVTRFIGFKYRFLNVIYYRIRFTKVAFVS